jgi:hypothetical protein
MILNKNCYRALNLSNDAQIKLWDFSTPLMSNMQAVECRVAFVLLSKVIPLTIAEVLINNLA